MPSPVAQRRGRPPANEDPVGPRRGSLRSRTLAPFGFGLVVLVVLLGVGATLVAREAVDRELETRARSAARLLDRAIERSGERLAEDAERLAADSAGVTGTGPLATRRLESRVVDFAIERELSHVSVTRNSATAGNGRAGWRRLELSRRLLRRSASEGRPAAGSGVSARGEPLVLAASVAGAGRGGSVLLGQAIDRRLLAEVEAPLGALLHLRTPRGPRGKGPEEGLRTVTLPLGLADGSTVGLEATFSAKPLHDTTRATLLAAAGAGLCIVVLSVALLGALLRRSVLGPLRALRRGMERMKAGDYAVSVPVVGAAEVRLLSDGFNRIGGLVVDQRERLEALATTDSLTGLANHRAFHDALSEASRGGEKFALVLLDLDRFKLVNDTYGHPRGDELLREVARRLRKVARGGDTVGRLGGEEFGMLLPGADADTAYAAAERAREAIRAITLRDFPVDCSAGVAACPEDATEADRLIELADAALYQSKLAGRARTSRFDPRVSGPGAVAERQAVVRELLDRPEAVQCLFQPVVELERGTVVGYEALARFVTDRDMALSEWFDLARSCGLGPELQALAVARALAVPERPPGAWLSVNVDPSALASDSVQAVLPHDLSGIVIELTEQQLPADDRLLEDSLAALRERGALVALDDAGAGYAGLWHVVRVRPDLIKLDRSLVADVQSDQVRFALIEAFVSFARRTGAQVCAEGVETDEQLVALSEAEVMLSQGYRIAAPAPPWAAVSAGVADRLAG